jgi:hypothetical protein
LRGAVDIVGNITSTGTAHNFAAKSIPASAIGSFLGRTEFAANSEDFAIGLRYMAGGTMTYLGTTIAGAFVVSTGGGSAILNVDATGNITTPGTAHNFANNSIPAAAISGLPVTTQVLTQAAYDALATKSPTTLYLITG